MRRVALATLAVATATVAAALAVAGSTYDDEHPVDPKARVQACGPAYAATLARAFVSPLFDAATIEAAILKDLRTDKNARQTKGHSSKEIIFGIGPGSSGTRSTFMAMMLLNISGQHFKQHWVAEDCEQKNRPFNEVPDAIDDESTRYWGDSPVPFSWPLLWRRAPNAKFLMTDVDPDRWRAKRLSFRHGYCGRSNGQDCYVPLAFVPSGKIKDVFGLATAPANASRTAFEAYRTFVRCAIPAERLLWLNISAAEGLWPALLDFAGLPRDTTLTSLAGSKETVRLDNASTTFPHWGEAGCTMQGGECGDWRCDGLAKKRRPPRPAPKQKRKVPVLATNETSQCIRWSEAGECSANPGYMLVMCAEACAAVAETTPAPSPRPQPPAVSVNVTT